MEDQLLDLLDWYLFYGPLEIVVKWPSFARHQWWFVQFAAFGKRVKIEIFACCLQNSTHFMITNQPTLVTKSASTITVSRSEYYKMSSAFKRFTTMPFTRYMYTFPELSLHCDFSRLSRTLKLGLLSNLSWLSKRLYNLFFSKNLIQSLGSWAKSVVVVRSV